MATVEVSEISMDRAPETTPAARVHVSEIALTLTGAEPPGATVHVARIAMTLGIAPPTGGRMRREGGIWVPYTRKARYLGEWI